MTQSTNTVLNRIAQRVLTAWGAEALIGGLKIRVSNRLSRSLATCTPDTLEIRLRPDVLTFPPRIRREILVHELAHLVAHQQDPSSAPHGFRWQALVSAAGFTPRPRITAPSAPTRIDANVYEHRCPVCQFTRTARRPVPQWRCRSCTEAGLEGNLVISRRGRRRQLRKT